MILLIIFSLLFIAGSIYNASTGDTWNMLGDIVISIFLFLVYIFFRNEKKKGQAFLKWLLENRDDIHEGIAEYKGYRIDLESEITQFQFCLSFIAFSVKVPSRYFLKDDLSSISAKVIYTLSTLIFGWWAFPFGPIYTVQVVIKNMTGGVKKKVRDFINT